MLAQIGTTILGFFLLVVFLKRFFWSAILKVLDERRQQIEGDLAQAAKQKEEMGRLQQELSKRLSVIEEEARAKIQQAMAEGKRIAAEMQEEARTQSAAILAKAKDTVALELDKARVTLRDEVARMTVEATERVLRQKLDDKTDQRLIDSVVDELEQRYTRT